MSESREYLDQQTDILLTENRMQHERIAALEAQVQTLRTTLKFYSNAEDYPLAIMELSGFKLLKDGGKRAHAALAATGPKEKA